MNILGRIVCSNPFSFVLGFGVGLVGLYVANRIEEQRKLENMQKEIEAAVKALEAGNLKLVETEAGKAKKN